MKYINHDIWDIHSKGCTICITTNATIKKDNSLVMGRGVALEAKLKYPKLPYMLAEKINLVGNIPIYIEEYKIISFPTKNRYHEKSDLKLIKKSCQSLKSIYEFYKQKFKNDLIFLPFPGIGNGKLTKEEVEPVLKEEFDSCNYIVITEKL